jgi:hypothetical protein
MNAFRGLTPCRLVGRYQLFEKYIITIFRAEEAILGSWMDLCKVKKKEEKAGGMEYHFNPDVEDKMFLRNVGIYLQVYTATQNSRIKCRLFKCFSMWCL